jgi:pteridine reductase
VKLKGEIVLWTGATSKVGRVVVLELARRGAVVALHYNSSKKRAKSLSDKIKKLGGESAIFQADLSKIIEIKKLVRSVEKDLGPIDILVNNAANFLRVPLNQISHNDWKKSFDLNLRAPIFLIKRLAPRMKRRGGKIINIVDKAGIEPYPNYLPYSLSKAGLIAATKSFSKSLSRRVFICGVAPRKPKSYRQISKTILSMLTSNGVDGKRVAR